MQVQHSWHLIQTCTSERVNIHSNGQLNADSLTSPNANSSA